MNYIRNVIVLGFIGLCAVAWFVGNSRNQVQSNLFIGSIKEIGENSVTLSGFYRIPSDPNLEDTHSSKEVVVKVGNNTEIVKTLIYMPTVEELKASGGMYEPDKLRQEKVAGSLSDIKDNNVDALFAHSNSNILGDDKFTASKIEYRVSVGPQ